MEVALELEDLSRPVAALAIRMAAMVASVPVFDSRSRSAPRRISVKRSHRRTWYSVSCVHIVPSSRPLRTASLILGWLNPSIEAPFDELKSMYWCPSTSQRRHPSPWWK